MIRLFLTGLVLFTILGTFAQVTQNSLHFDGTNDNVQTTYTGVTGGNARTVEAWIKTTANSTPTGGKQKVIADYGSTGINGRRFTLNLLNDNAPRIEIAGGGLSSTTAVNDGNWHHIAAVYDPTATNKYILYIDGAFDTSGNITQPINTVVATNFVIGRRIDGINNFEGQIDEVRFWSTARTATEIADYYDEEICPTMTGLEAYYDFNSGTANGVNTSINSLDDLTSGSKNGTLNNFALSGTTSNWTNGTNITAAPNSDTVLYDTACGLYQSPGGQIVFSSQQIVEHTPNALGCDSTITINVLVKPSEDIYVNEYACDSFRTALGQLKTVSSIYWETFTNIHGCDSNVQTLLTIYNSSSDTLYESTCNTYTSPSGRVLDQDGIYSDSLLNQNDCDSIIVIYLDVLEATSSNFSISQCFKYQSPSGKVFETSGNYIDTISNVAGCDSIMSINFNLKSPSDTIIKTTSCDSFVTNSGSHTITQSLKFNEYLKNSIDCDSIINYDISIIFSTSGSGEAKDCDQYIAPWGELITTSGFYTGVIKNSIGCDSNLTLNVTIIDHEPEAVVNAKRVSTNFDADSYQWLDCKKDYAIIPDATEFSLEPKSTSEFSVQVFKDGCYDTSNCVPFTYVTSVSNILAGNFILSPNPARDFITIDSKFPILEYRITNSQGQQINEGKYVNGTQLDITHLSQGMYFISLTHDGLQRVLPMVVK